MRTRIHLGMNRADIDAKEADRQRLQRDLEAFKAKGGKVESVTPKQKPLHLPTMQQINDASWDKRAAKPRSKKC